MENLNRMKRNPWNGTSYFNLYFLTSFFYCPIFFLSVFKLFNILIKTDERKKVN